MDIPVTDARRWMAEPKRVIKLSPIVYPMPVAESNQAARTTSAVGPTVIAESAVVAESNQATQTPPVVQPTQIIQSPTIVDIKSSPTTSDIKIERETSDKLEQRRLKELIITPESKEIHAVPYEWIGRDISNVYPNEAKLKPNYHDWHAITPAYSMKFSGRSPSYLLKSLFTPSSSNSIFNRAKRWAHEDHSVVYRKWYSKIATLFLLSLTIFTFIISFRDALKTTDTTFIQILRWGKVTLTFISLLISTWGMFKRTTIPASNTIITGFNPPKIKQRQMNRASSIAIMNIDSSHSSESRGSLPSIVSST